MKQLKICFGLFLLCTVYGISSATGDNDMDSDKDTHNPLGCRDMGYRFELKTLQLTAAQIGDRQSLYFILNKLNQPVNFYQMRDTQGSRDLYLNHVLHPQQWGVLSMGEKNLHYICTVNDAAYRYGRIVDCGESLQVCEYNNVVYGMNNRGNYWLVNSNSKNAALREVVRYGMIPAP